uniref:Uncharacterized protein n=1 Tax=Zea mays TaxID=4577 RepID=A0A804PVA1_MAIZE
MVTWTNGDELSEKTNGDERTTWPRPTCRKNAVRCHGHSTSDARQTNGRNVIGSGCRGVTTEEEDEAGRGAWRLGEEQPRRVVVVLSFHFHASQYTEKTTSEREFVISFSSAPLPGLSCCLSSPRLTLVGCWQYTAALSGLHLRCTYAGRGGEKRTTLLLVILMESAAE